MATTTINQDKPNEYNGCTNYETWKLNLNIDNEQGLSELVREFIKQQITDEDLNTVEFKEYLEELSEECNEESINNIGYKFGDFWSFNEWEEINFNEVYAAQCKAYIEDLMYRFFGGC